MNTYTYTNTYPEMNADIVDILRQGENPAGHYAAERIKELEGENEQLRAALKIFADVWYEWESLMLQIEEFGGNLTLRDVVPLTEEPYRQAAQALQPAVKDTP